MFASVTCAKCAGSPREKRPVNGTALLPQLMVVFTPNFVMSSRDPFLAKISSSISTASFSLILSADELMSKIIVVELPTRLPLALMKERTGHPLFP